MTRTAAPRKPLGESFAAMDQAVELLQTVKRQIRRSTFMMPSVASTESPESLALYCLQALEKLAQKSMRDMDRFPEETPERHGIELHLNRLSQGRFILTEAWTFAQDNQ